MSEAPAIEALGLVREFKKGPRAVDGIDLEVGARRDLRVPRPQRRRQVDHRPHADHAPAADRGTARVAGYDIVTQGTRCARRSARRCRRPRSTPSSPAASTCAAGRLHGLPRGRWPARGEELLERVGLTEAADRRVGGYSGGCSVASTSRSRWSTQPARAVPRRADDRPGPAEPHGAVGRGRRASPGGRRHRLPDDAVPGGGRRPGRSRRHHRPRPHRRRGHAGRAEGGDRRARPSRSCRARRTTRAAMRACSPASATGTPAGRRVAVRLEAGAERARRRRARPRRRGHRDRQPAAARAHPRRRVPGQDRPPPGGRVQRREPRPRRRPRRPSRRECRSLPRRGRLRARPSAGPRSACSRGVRSCARRASRRPWVFALSSRSSCWP